MRRSRAPAASEREREILRISEALAERGFYVFGPGAAAPAPAEPRAPPPDRLN